MRKETIGPCELWLGDCREVMASGIVQADVIATDPPYGINHKCNFAERGRSNLAACNNYPDVFDDDKPFDPSLILSLNLPTILWGGNHFADKLPASGGWLVWDKERPDDLDQATCELAWTNCVKSVRRLRHLWHGMMKASERGENYHPTQKPVALYVWLLSLTWIPQGLVFDPYMGSGPCGVASIRTGHRYWGIEIAEPYFNIACRRIEREWRLKQSELPFEKIEPAVQREMFDG